MREPGVELLEQWFDGRNSVETVRDGVRLHAYHMDGVILCTFGQTPVFHDGWMILTEARWRIEDIIREQISIRKRTNGEREVKLVNDRIAFNRKRSMDVIAILDGTKP